MSPCVVPAITAIVRAPIAHRETFSVMCSQTSSQRSASAGTSMLRTVSLRFDMSTSRKSARKRTVNSASPMENASPATPRIALIASGTEAARLFAPS